MRDKARPEGRPVWAFATALVLFLALNVTSYLLMAQDTRAATPGPAAEEFLSGIADPPDHRLVESERLDQGWLDELGIAEYEGLVRDGHVRRWTGPDGGQLTVLVIRTGDSSSAVNAHRYLVEALSGSRSEDITDPVEGAQAASVDGTGVVTAMRTADVVVVVVQSGGGTPGAGAALVVQLDEAMRGAGFVAPFVENPVAQLLRMAAFVWVIGGLLWCVRLFVRWVRSHGTPRTMAGGATIDAGAQAVRLRRTGRIVGVLQFGGLVAMSQTFLAGPVFVSTPAGQSVPRPLVNVGSVVAILLIGVVATMLLRVAEGRRTRLPSTVAGRLLALLPAAAGIAVFLFGLITVSYIAVANVVGLEFHFRVPRAIGPGEIIVGILSLALGFVCLGTTVTLAALAFRGARLLRVRSARAAAELPAEAALLLRSFRDDRSRVPALAGGRRSLLDAWSLRATDRFEEVVAWELSDRWPVVAVAEPGGPKRALGAARVSLGDHQWQAAVWQQLHQCPCVVAVLGDTPGFGWEVGAVLRSGALARTVFLLPPIPWAQRSYRLALLHRALVEAGATPSPIPAPESAIALLVDAQHRIVTIGVDRWDEAGYRAALRAAFDALNLHAAEPALTGARAN